jgi:hypothetical protein
VDHKLTGDVSFTMQLPMAAVKKTLCISETNKKKVKEILTQQIVMYLFFSGSDIFRSLFIILLLCLFSNVLNRI